jgi:ribosome-binding factor A
MGVPRTSRLNEQLRRELSDLIRQRVRDPRVGAVTITAVDTTRDLGLATVYVRATGPDAGPSDTLAGLSAAAPFLRTALGRALRIRRVPELRFREDKSLEHAKRIEQLLSEVIEPDAPPEDSEAE